MEVAWILDHSAVVYLPEHPAKLAKALDALGMSRIEVCLTNPIPHMEAPLFIPYIHHDFWVVFSMNRGRDYQKWNMNHFAKKASTDHQKQSKTTRRKRCRPTKMMKMSISSQRGAFSFIENLSKKKVHLLCE